jgi:hypothetical protein
MNCSILAARPYVSPRERPLTGDEARTRDIAFALKEAKAWALAEAVPEMAALVRGDDVLVPVPARSGSTRANLAIARRVAWLTGATVCDALGRMRPAESVRVRRSAGRGPGERYLVRFTDCPAGRIVLVDNVATTGGTGQACAAALGEPCVLLVWAWHRSEGTVVR